MNNGTQMLLARYIQDGIVSYVVWSPDLYAFKRAYVGRDGDKDQARHRIAYEVRIGARPAASNLACADCVEWHVDGEPPYQYDHHLGYAAENHRNVQPVCTKCHTARDSAKVAQTACIRGHVFDEENTRIRGNGTRECKRCKRNRGKAARR